MKVRVDYVERVSWTTCGATVFAVASLFLQLREIELQSEIICCTILLILNHVITIERLRPPDKQTSALSWISATCMAIASLCFAEGNSFIFFVSLGPYRGIICFK
jgi:hypothetical protein